MLRSAGTPAAVASTTLYLVRKITTFPDDARQTLKDAVRGNVIHRFGGVYGGVDPGSSVTILTTQAP